MLDSTKFDINRHDYAANGFINLLSRDVKPFDWRSKTGSLPFKLTNDFIFRATAQHDENVLKGYISAGAHIDPDDIKILLLKNPILPSDNIEGKEFVLDILAMMNDGTAVNLEMQVMNYGDWPERSLNYACREFDRLNKGDFYKNAKAAVHISFLDFSLGKETSCLWEAYRVLNVRTYESLTDKFQLFFVNLPKRSLAAEEDRKYHTDLWAAYFKARTYEELKMIAEKDKNIEAAAQIAFSLWSDERTRRMIEDREEYMLMQRTFAQERDDLTRQVDDLRKQVGAEQTNLAKAQAYAKEAKARADEEKARADEEKARADEEKARADLNEAKLKALEAKLKSLGIS